MTIQPPFFPSGLIYLINSKTDKVIVWRHTSCPKLNADPRTNGKTTFDSRSSNTATDNYLIRFSSSYVRLSFHRPCISARVDLFCQWLLRFQLQHLNEPKPTLSCLNHSLTRASRGVFIVNGQDNPIRPVTAPYYRFKSYRNEIFARQLPRLQWASFFLPFCNCILSHSAPIPLILFSLSIAYLFIF